jgi:hypothetical protein
MLRSSGNVHAASARRSFVEPPDDPVPKRSAVNLDSVENVSVAMLIERNRSSRRRQDARRLRCAGSRHPLRKMTAQHTTAVSKTADIRILIAGLAEEEFGP